LGKIKGFIQIEKRIRRLLKIWLLSNFELKYDFYGFREGQNRVKRRPLATQAFVCLTRGPYCSTRLFQ